MLPAGTVFAERYEILRTLSAGGMGTVYEVLHRETRRKRALKVMLPSMLEDADLRRRFALEAQVTADIDSEHIVETFDAGVDADSSSPFLVMELLRGEDLGPRLTRLVRLPPSEVVGLLSQAAEALDKTHAADIVHRDLKPENLFAVARDGTLRLKLLDFGIAKVMRRSEVGKATRNMGTPLYMSPEQFDGVLRIGPRVDLYALAHIAFTLLAGEPYWAPEARELESALALMKRVSKGASEPATARASRLGVVLPAAFDAWFECAAARHPDDRFASATETVEELAEALELRSALGAPVLGTVPSTVDGTKRPVIAPAGSGSSRDIIGSQTTQPGRERDPSGAADGTSPAFARTGPASRGWVPLIAALAVVSAGITYFGLRTDGGRTAPGASVAGAIDAPPPTSTDPQLDALFSAPHATSSAPRELPVTDASASATGAPPASAAPRARPTLSRPPSSPLSAGAASATPPPATSMSAPPPEPWRTR